jgi:hypothetical protein
MSDKPDIPELLDVNSRFLHAYDLRDSDDKWKEFTVTVKRVHPAGSVCQQDSSGKNGKPIPHQVLEFANAQKMFVLTSVINKRRLLIAHGKDLTGKAVTLYPVSGNWFNTPGTLGIRVRRVGTLRTREEAKDVGVDLTVK